MDQESRVADLTLPKGVTIRIHRSGERSIQIAFSYEGNQCREALRCRAPTKANIRFASDLIARIRSEIAQGTFDYLRHFPNSKRARVILGRGATCTVSELLDDFLVEQQDQLAPSTMASWRSMTEERIKPGVGHLLVRDLTTSQIAAWIMSKDMQHLSLKFVRNCVTPLRRALYHAVKQGHRTENPAASKSLSVKECVPKAYWNTGWVPDPLNQSEIDAVLAACETPAARNFFSVAFETGLRTGEQIALKWKDIDFDNRLLNVERAIIEGYEKSTKTLAGQRTVELSDTAIEALRDQLDLTKHKVRVFCHPKTLLALKNSGEVYAMWVPAVRRAEIRYRCPRQTRHTYASRLISVKGVNLFWLAKQMGHVGIQMLNQHYARWIENNPRYRNGNVGTATGPSLPDATLGAGQQ